MTYNIIERLCKNVKKQYKIKDSKSALIKLFNGVTSINVLPFLKVKGYDTDDENVKHIGNTNRTQTPPVTKSGQRILTSSDSPTTGSPTGQDLVNLAYNLPPLSTNR